MTTAPETLPDFSADYALSAAQITNYRENGHVLLRGVCSLAESAAYREALNKPVYTYSTENGKMVLQIMNMWENIEEKKGVVRRYVLAKRFRKIAADLMGVSDVCLYQGQNIDCQSQNIGGFTFGPGQLGGSLPLDTTNTVTMWMPLVDVTIETEVLTFASGSHDAWDKLVKEKGYPVRDDVMQAGDATFHAGLHFAPSTACNLFCEVMIVILYDHSVKPSGGIRF